MPPDFDNDVLEIFEWYPGSIGKPTQPVIVDDAPARVSIRKLLAEQVWPERPQQGTAIRGRLWLPEPDMVIQASSRSRAMVLRLLSGVRLLDADESAVPVLQRCTLRYIRAELDAAGLRAKITGKSDIMRFTCGTTPEAYSVVPKGSTVTVSLTR
jgi:hypothetical protein